MRTIHLGKKTIGPDSPALIIAEAGVNHNTQQDLAIQLIDEAAKAGADVIKFQTYRADKLVTKTAPKYYVDTMAEWKAGKRSSAGYQSDEFSQLDSLSTSNYKTMMNHAEASGIIWMSTPFDEESADLLESLGVLAFKIASGDITSHRLLRHVAAKGKPMLLSTGCSSIGDIEEALAVIRSTGNDQIALMHCILAYPTAPKDAHINMMRMLQQVFPDIPIGLSDHTLGTVAPTIAASHGARLIEKHFTLDKALGTSTDHFMSVDPAELKRMVSDIRDAEAMMGSWQKISTPAEELAHKYARRSVVAARPIARGAQISDQDLILKRPGTGIEPRFIDILIGKEAGQDIPVDTVLTWEMIK